MTVDEFRNVALEIPGAVELSHMNHPDFRIEGKISQRSECRTKTGRW